MVEVKSNNVDLDLVGVIYDTALDPDFWPAMLRGLASEVEAGKVNQFLPGETTGGQQAELISQLEEDLEQELMDRLMPHFKRAFEINSHVLALEYGQRVNQSIINQIPLGILVVNGDGKIILKNNYAEKILQGGGGLMEKEGMLACQNNMATAHLFATIQTMIHQTKQNGRSKNRSLSIKTNGHTAPQSVLLSSNSLFQTEQYWEREYVTVLIAAPGNCIEVDVQSIKDHFGLTPATARLACSLVAGQSLEEYAKEHELSINTVRAQLKSLFSLTGTNSQVKLMRKILTSPVIYEQKNTESRESIPQVSIDMPQDSVREGSFRLSDNRLLGFAEYGDPHDYPVFLFHGTYGSRYFRHPDEHLTREAGVRLICPERPGFGISAVKKNRSILDWVSDVQELVQHLGIDKFSIIGHDAGGCYALACAHRKMKGLRSVLVCNSYAAYETISDFNNAVPNEKLFYSLARFLPTLFIRYSQFQLSKLTQDFTWYYKRITRYLPDCDREIVLNPKVIGMFYQTSLEGLKNAFGFAKDMVLITHDWGFDPSHIELPVHVWHGEENRHIPVCMGQRLAEAMPGAKPCFVEGSGHFLIISHWQEILRQVIPRNS